MEDTTNPETEVDAVDAIANLLDGPEDDREPEEPEDEVADEPNEAAVEGDDADEAEPDEAEDPPEETEELSWNGETKNVSKSELKELAQKGFDYTQKTQQLSDARRQFDADVESMKQSFALQNEQIDTIAELKAIDAQLEHFKDVDWHQLAESDPVQYLKLNQTFRDLKDARTGKVSEFQNKAQYLQQQSEQGTSQRLQFEAKALAEALPEFRGEKAAKSRDKVKSYLAENGFKPEEIAAIADHRMVKVAWEAAKWRELQSSKPALNKRVAETPKVVKTGTPKVQATQASRDVMSNLKKTGRGEYAAKLIESMI